MTTPPTPTNAAEPLWPDDRIAWFADNAATAWEARHIADAMKKVRNDMQLEIDRLSARIDELEAENRELSRMVSLEFEQAMKGSKND